MKTAKDFANEFTTLTQDLGPCINVLHLGSVYLNPRMEFHFDGFEVIFHLQYQTLIPHSSSPNNPEAQEVLKRLSTIAPCFVKHERDVKLVLAKKPDNFWESTIREFAAARDYQIEKGYFSDGRCDLKTRDTTWKLTYPFNLEICSDMPYYIKGNDLLNHIKRLRRFKELYSLIWRDFDSFSHECKSLLDLQWELEKAQYDLLNE